MLIINSGILDILTPVFPIFNRVIKSNRSPIELKLLGTEIMSPLIPCHTRAVPVIALLGFLIMIASLFFILLQSFDQLIVLIVRPNPEPINVTI